MIRADVLEYLMNLHYTELYTEHLRAVSKEVDSFAALIPIINDATIDGVTSQNELVLFEQNLNDKLLTFRNALNYRLHCALAINIRAAKNKKEMDNRI
jgi:hypothetical protein